MTIRRHDKQRNFPPSVVSHSPRSFKSKNIENLCNMRCVRLNRRELVDGCNYGRKISSIDCLDQAAAFPWSIFHHKSISDTVLVLSFENCIDLGGFPCQQPLKKLPSAAEVTRTRNEFTGNRALKLSTIAVIDRWSNTGNLQVRNILIWNNDEMKRAREVRKQ